MSKFAGLVSDDAPAIQEPASKPTKKTKATAKATPATLPDSDVSAQRMLTLVSGGSYRENKSLSQVSGYIHKETHKAVRKALIDDDRERDFSQLMQELLEAWLNS